MGTKLSRVLDEIEKTEGKIALWQGHLEELHTRRKQLEDAEIIKSVRSMRLGSREMLAFLENLQRGRVSAQELPGMNESRAEEAADHRDGAAGIPDNRGPGNQPAEAGNDGRPENIPAERKDGENEEKD